MDRLQILCLHGYHGSGDVLRRQMAALVDGMESLAEFVYLDAPSLARGDFGWWHARNVANQPLSGDAGVGPSRKRYEGWERTLASIAEAFSEGGPFDGVFGFSQGASLASLLVGLRSPGGGPAAAARPLAFEFAVMAGGFPGADPNLAVRYTDGPCYALPSVHLMGLRDPIVPAPLSRALASVFKDPLIVEHDGGHVIAATPTARSEFRKFLEDMLGRKESGPDFRSATRRQA